jgi:DNA repair protein RadC
MPGFTQALQRQRLSRLAKRLPSSPTKQAMMAIDRPRQIQQALQQHMQMRGEEQILAADDMADACSASSWTQAR